MKKIVYSLIFLSCLLFTSCYTTFWGWARIVESNRMEPNLIAGDLVQIKKNVPEYHYGDIVLIDEEIDLGDSKLHGLNVYRIVGLPGDSIGMEDCICIINGKKNKTEFLNNATWRGWELELVNETFPDGHVFQVYKNIKDMDSGELTWSFDMVRVPENHYFMLGDQRPFSMRDSRYFLRFVRESQIKGKITKVKRGDRQWLIE